MRVIIIANGFQVDYIQNLVPGLAKHITKVEFIGSDIYSFLGNSQIEFYNLRGSHDEHAGMMIKMTRIFKYYFRLMLFLIRSKATVVHIQWIRFELIDGVVFPIIIRLLGKKVVYTAHNVIPHDTSGKWVEFKFWMIYSLQNLILVHTNFIKNELLIRFKVKENRVVVVPHGVYRVQDNNEIDKVSARRELGIPEDKFVILFFGIVSKYKGYDLLVDASNLITDIDRCFFLVGGKINPDYRAEFDQISQRCREDSFKFLSKYLTEREVEICFKASDVCVIPYREASQSGVLFMAYAYGLPVIAPDIGGFKDDILYGKTGLLYSGVESASLAKAIDLATSVNFLQREDMKEYVDNTYSWDIIGANLAKIYFTLN